MPSFPSFYLSSLERKRQRSRDMSEGIDKASDSLMGGIDRMGQLEALLHERGDADERKRHGREIEAKNQARADERFGWEKEDRKRKIEDEDTSRLLEDDIRRMRMGNAFDKIEADVAAEDDVVTDRQEMMRRALAGVADSDETNTTMMTPEQRLAEEKARKAKADADIAEKKARGGPGKPDPIKAKRERLLDAQIAAAEAKNEAKEEPEKPSTKDAMDVEEFTVTIDVAKKLAADKGEIDTGPFANARNWLAQKAGVSDPKVTAFKAQVGEQLADYIASISGATVSEPERARLMENIPTMGDNDEAFMAKLNRVINMLEAKRTAQLRALKAAGKDVSAFESVERRGVEPPLPADAIEW